MVVAATITVREVSSVDGKAALMDCPTEKTSVCVSFVSCVHCVSWLSWVVGEAVVAQHVCAGLVTFPTLKNEMAGVATKTVVMKVVVWVTTVVNKIGVEVSTVETMVLEVDIVVKKAVRMVLRVDLMAKAVLGLGLIAKVVIVDCPNKEDPVFVSYVSCSSWAGVITVPLTKK